MAERNFSEKSVQRMEEEVRNKVKAKLNEIKDQMGWSTKELGRAMGDKSGPGVAPYLEGERIPRLDTLLYLCRNEHLRANGIELTVDSFLEDGVKSDNVGIIEEFPPFEAQPADGHLDLVGAYSVYRLDKRPPSKSTNDRPLYVIAPGVITIFDMVDKYTGAVRLMALGMFHNDPSRSYRMEEIKGRISGIFNSFEEERDRAARNASIIKAYQEYSREDGVGVYPGEVEFGDRNVYINMSSALYSDKLRITLHLPQTHGDPDYLGGLGSMCAVNHSSDHDPFAKVVGLSRYSLDVEASDIVACLGDSDPEYRPTPDSKMIEECLEFCMTICSGESRMSTLLSETDKKTLLANRLWDMVVQLAGVRHNSELRITERSDTKYYELLKTKRR